MTKSDFSESVWAEPGVVVVAATDNAGSGHGYWTSHRITTREEVEALMIHIANEAVKAGIKLDDE